MTKLLSSMVRQWICILGIATITTSALAEELAQAGNFLEVGDDHQIWYHDSGGTTPALVFLHSGSGSGLAWNKQLQFFQQSGYRTITYSRRGYVPSIMGDPERQGVGADDLLLLLDHLELERVHLVGTAQGGVIATDFATAYQERLSSAVLANTIFGIADEEFRLQLQRLMAPELRLLPAAFIALGPSYRHSNPDGVAAWETLHSHPASRKMVLEHMSREIFLEDLAQWDIPVLLITGDADLLMPASLMEIVHKRIPHSEFHVITDAGHSAHWERPDEFNQLALNFLKKKSNYSPPNRVSLI